MALVCSVGLLVGFCLIMLTICQDNGVRSPKQTRLIYFTGLCMQPNYCITNSDSFTLWRSTLISACHTGSGVFCGTCMLTSFLYHSQTTLTAESRSRHLVLHISEGSKWTCLEQWKTMLCPFNCWVKIGTLYSSIT